jgi:hypothetical protein
VALVASNRDIAISYLDVELGDGVAGVMQRIRKAMKKTGKSSASFNVITLEFDPEAGTITLHQDWFACDPETFTVTEFKDLVEGSRRRSRG